MKTSLKVSVALALATTFASTGAMAADKEFNLGGFARYDLNANSYENAAGTKTSTFGDGYRVQLNAVGKATNDRNQFVKGVAQIRMNAGESYSMGDVYVQAGNERVNVQMGRFYDISVWDEGGEERFVTEGEVGGLVSRVASPGNKDVFYTAESARNRDGEAHVAVNFTPNSKMKAQVSVRHGENVDGATAGVTETKTTQIRPAVTYNAGRYNLAAAYQHRKNETTTVATGATADTTTSGIVVSGGTKVGMANVRLSASSGKVEQNGVADVKRKAVGLAVNVKSFDIGLLSAEDKQGTAKDKTTAVYADLTRPLMGVKGAKVIYSLGTGETETTGSTAANNGTQKATHAGVRVKYSF